MNILKFFNLKSKKQKLRISADIENILLKCDNIANKEYNDEKLEQKSHNEICPNCQAIKGSIVNKISHIKGTGQVHNHIMTGRSELKINIDTFEVNHCNVCGNEWKKYNLKYVSSPLYRLKSSAVNQNHTELVDESSKV